MPDTAAPALVQPITRALAELQATINSEGVRAFDGWLLCAKGNWFPVQVGHRSDFAPHGKIQNQALGFRLTRGRRGWGLLSLKGGRSRSS